MGRLAARVDLARLNAEFLGDDSVVFQSALNDCGPAALANMMRAVGVEVPSTDTLAVLADMGPRGTTAGGLIRAADRFGLPLTLVRLTRADLRDARTPFIAWVNRNQFRDGYRTIAVRSSDRGGSHGGALLDQRRSIPGRSGPGESIVLAA